MPATIIGCAAVPVWATAREYRVLAASAQDATYASVVSLTDSLGYSVRASDRTGGFVRVERYYVPPVHYQARDLINASIVTGSDHRAALRLTAWTEETHRDLFGPTDVSDRVLKDATELATRCGGGRLTVWSDTART
jgi:hypothetical protein